VAKSGPSEKNRESCANRAGIRLAIPNKGRIAGPVMELLEKSGLHLLDLGERRLISRTPDPQVEVLFARPVDIPEYVADGAADLGITGRDLVLERQAFVEELLDLKLGQASLVLAVPEDSPIGDLKDLAGMRVATEFPVIAANFFKCRSLKVSLVVVGGACEIAPHLGIADAILDLTSSGETLRSNRLRVISRILDTSTVLITHPETKGKKTDKLEEIVLAIGSVIHAQGQCYLMMNARREHLGQIKNVLPGLSGPTIMEVASSEDLVAVHAVVCEEQVYGLIAKLKKAGARDILVMPIERMIR
jgi:ATP phosphoribosyltransferase